MTAAKDTAFYTCSYSRGTAYFAGVFVGTLVSMTVAIAAFSFDNWSLPVAIAFATLLAFSAAAAYYSDYLFKKSIQRGDEPTDNDNDDKTT